ncbi:sn-glycerol-3-phosphate ABC transporter ATP-binding protein UgpC [Paraburkholderia sp. CNPSo 3157]|uniref:sn-glycerol-3-phosphate ABC transporter ATP-binding protein UgpC n=1 Tax=Paraburkholderia franconis TaxID=2654983 RepID=A0A7X1NIP9_9BURK|nr:sn-glycerol-3-phosphate import ATP-binding protein UgpC [Paraburkholderia franconis]MPW22186.1 sn-glycerol-3-phosphate ABC transporter ATP-binding protein UgpC [Paraburkholderia franconis]
MSALTLKGVKKSYDGKQNVLHGINADVRDGEFVVMVGPSGCGKSTLLRMVAGLEAVTEGEIAIDGKVVNDLEPKDRNIAMVFQNYALYPHMTVAENMGYALKIAGLPKSKIEARVLTAAKILELEPLLSRKPRELSGGQRQRVAMGRAIVREPAVFLFDEPLSNLDARLRVQMRLEIQRLHGRLKTTSLYVTHDQIEAMTLAQRVIVMNRGHAEQIGAPTEVYERPATTFVAGFIGSPGMNLLNGRIADDGASFEVAGDGPKLPLEGVPCIGREVVAGRVCVLGIRPEHMTPEQPGASAATLGVDSCELLGADNLAHGRWGRHDVTVRLPHAHRPSAGEMLQIALPARHLHFFDEEDGKRLN